MTCREAIEFLMDYLDGALPADRRVAFESHLSICPSCVAFLQSYEQTVRLEKVVREHEADDAAEVLPEDLVTAILASR